MEIYSSTNVGYLTTAAKPPPPPQFGIPAPTIAASILVQPSGYTPAVPAYPPQQAGVYPPPPGATLSAPPPTVGQSAPTAGEGVALGQVIGQQIGQRVGEMWSTGLFDCSQDPENALLTCVAPCVTFGQIAEVLDEGRTPCTTSGCIYCVSGFAIILPLLLSSNLRSRLRASFNLLEEPGPDIFIHLCFESCALCQEYRELKNRGFNPELGWAGIQTARLNPGTMTPPPPVTMMYPGGAAMSFAADDERPPSFATYGENAQDGGGDQMGGPPPAAAPPPQRRYQAPPPPVYRPAAAAAPGYGYQQAATPVSGIPTPAGWNYDQQVNYGQPKPAAQNAAYPATTPPRPVQCPPVGQRVGEMWSTGLFDCLDDPTNALLTLLAPCVTFGQITEILDEGRTSCTTSGSLYFLATFAIILPSLLSTNLRTRLRTSFNLMADPGPDLFVHLCFEYCALCQEYRELKNRGLNPEIGWLGVQMMRQQQQQQLGSMAPPQPQMMHQ
ncbi:uncharacterized protein [Typha angustifolia]|uniref:uncharacterized protein n=1 Tax=Typha angustifolia TaxID=59011 RepID=UPI003C2CEDCB